MDIKTQDNIIKLYEQGKSIYEVGAEVGLSYVSVWNVLKSNEVEMRQRGPTKGVRYVKESGEFVVKKRFSDGTHKPKDVLIFEINSKIDIPEGFAVYHLNGKKTDCDLTNLALVTVDYYKSQMGEYPPYYKPKKEDKKESKKESSDNASRKTVKAKTNSKASKVTSKKRK